tara:strand:- start:965 stop:1891 length:927 start_codon:yes stop_codon:yes gene_type:complete
MKYLIYSIGLILLVIYIFRRKKLEEFKVNGLTTEMKEGGVKVFNTDILLRSDDVFKKNIDLSYHNRVSNIQDDNNLFTNKIPPIINAGIGINEVKDRKVADVAKKLTNRLPDNLSNQKKYNIPMPKFDDLQKHKINIHKKKSDIIKTKKTIEELKKTQKKEEFRIAQSSKNAKASEKKCMFVSSLDNSNKCPNDYPNYTGATFSGNGSNLNCSNDKITTKRAKAIAQIKQGKVSKVIMIDGGTHYTNSPKVYFRGEGTGAVGNAVIKNGLVTKINIINGGQFYVSTPTVIIEKPVINITCNLCCKGAL